MQILHLSTYDWHSIAEAWTELEKNNPGGEATFAGHTFCSSVKAGPDANSQPLILLAKEGDQLVGVWPLAIVAESLATTLRPYGTPIPQYGTILIDSTKNAAQIATAFCDYLKENKFADIIDMPRLWATSGLFVPTSEMQDIDINTAEDQAFMAPLVDLKRWLPEWAGEPPIKKSLAKDIRRKRRRLSESENIQTKLVQDPDKRAEAIKLALEWKYAWLDARHLLSATLRAQSTVDMLLEIATAKTSNMLIWETCADGEPVAIEIGFGDADYYFAYLGCYKPELEVYGPGSVQMVDTLEQLAQMGVKHYDLLEPVEGYKTRWAHIARPNGRYMAHFSIRGQMMAKLSSPEVRNLAKTAWYSLPESVRAPVQKAVSS